eukprot:COSAG06_NODE_459_length_15440_cov_87.208135_11_plen_91_part_00
MQLIRNLPRDVTFDSGRVGCGVVRGPLVGARDDIDPASLTAHQVTITVGGKEISTGNATNNPVQNTSWTVFNCAVCQSACKVQLRLRYTH